MKNFFEQSRSCWVRYDRYELKTAADGKCYITPGKDAKPEVYNPLKEAPAIVLDALNVGMLMMGRKPAGEVQAAILEFVTNYGLLGFMTALPTTPSFMEYEAVYLPKNHFIRAETMSTEDYFSAFFPFESLDVVKQGVESCWSVSEDRPAAGPPPPAVRLSQPRRRRRIPRFQCGSGRRSLWRPGWPPARSPRR